MTCEKDNNNILAATAATATTSLLKPHFPEWQYLHHFLDILLKYILSRTAVNIAFPMKYI